MPKNNICVKCGKEFELNSWDDEDEVVLCGECYDEIMSTDLKLDKSIMELIPQSDGYQSWYDIALIRYAIIKILNTKK
jgi:hypothetical protein